MLLHASLFHGFRRTHCLATTIVALAGLVVSTLSAPPAAADDWSSRIDAAIDEVEAKAIEFRHQIHRNPELGNREFETAALITEHLKSLGYEVRTEIAVTGVVGLLQGGRPGPVVALRADMDALPVVEQTDLPFKSTKRTTYGGQEVGVAHACGHDIHTSVQMGVAEILASMRADLPGTIMLIFQPAEEGPPPGEEAGARRMMDENVFADPKPDAIFALHAFSDFEVGEVGLNPGPTMAAVDQFVAKIKGKQAHGAYPHLGVDPVVMSAQAITALQTIRSRTLPALEPSVVTVGIVRGGERFNIIPSEVRLEGTVRTYRDEVRETVQRRMHEILDGITRAGGGSYSLEYEQNTPATVNDDDLTAWARGVLETSLGADKVNSVEPTMGGEDFAYFARAVPGFYFRLGIVKPGTHSGALHTPDFRADDSAVAVGMRAMANLAVRYLEDHASSDRPTD